MFKTTNQFFFFMGIVELLGSAIIGPVVGILPPSMQRYLYDGDEIQARISSTSSRIVNGCYGAYGFAQLALKPFGVDISTGNSILDNASYVMLADTIWRESSYWLTYYFAHPNMRKSEVWGEPVITHTVNMFKNSVR